MPPVRVPANPDVSSDLFEVFTIEYPFPPIPPPPKLLGPHCHSPSPAVPPASPLPPIVAVCSESAPRPPAPPPIYPPSPP